MSDIHGVPSALEAALKAADALGYDRLALLGDLLYHGPRNGVPNFYDPVKVAGMLNELKDRIVAVRGNCDAEVDQMMFEFPMMSDYAVLEAEHETFFLTHGHLYQARLDIMSYSEVDQMMFQFPIMADYAVLDAGTERFFLTHGHLWNEYSLPPLGMGTVLAHGHTHVPELKRLECGITIFNPGSVALPKGGSSRSFGYFDGSELRHYVI